MGFLLGGKLSIGCPVGNRLARSKNREGASQGGPRGVPARARQRGVLGFVVELLLLGLLLSGGLLGFIPVPLEPGGLDVSVVEPVVGAAGRVVSLPELVEPLTLPWVAPLVPVVVSPRELVSVEVEWRDVSIGARPLARRRDFIEPCWLQSHLQSLPIESLPIVVEALSRDVLVDMPVLRSDVVAVAELDVEPLSAAVLLEVSGRDFVLSALVSFLVSLLVDFDWSAPVCAIAAGAAKAIARIAVAASFIIVLRFWSQVLPGHGGDDSAAGQCTSPRRRLAVRASGRLPKQKEGGERVAALLPHESRLARARPRSSSRSRRCAWRSGS
jgi:hypothetical protein